LLHQLALLEFFLRDEDALRLGEVEGLRRRQLRDRLVSLQLLYLFRRHEVAVVVVEHREVGVNLTNLFELIADADFDFAAESLLCKVLKCFVLAEYFSQGLAKPYSEFAEVSLVLAGEPKLFGIGAFPELLDGRPLAISQVRRLFQVLVRVVVGITFWTIEAMVEICLPIVSQVKHVEVIVFEVVLSSAIETGLCRRWGTKRFY
jgi:hypothetical protein